MADRTALTAGLLAYVDSLTPEPPALRAVRDETTRMPMLARMVSSAAQARLLALLVATIDARRVLEIGTFTGYSTLAMALSAGPDCVITTCDSVPRWTRIAKRHWDRNGVTGKITLRLGDAGATLAELVATEAEFDLAYIDADKASYPTYYRRCMRLVRPGGLVLLDNTFCLGRVADRTATDAETEAVREVNRLIKADERAQEVVLTIGDGLTIVRRNQDF
ncbi:SAM-dependent methyltransferase [Amycolatopsis thailandensis]|uniref:SAM-dependent methyltransferase n=1 Tax=Amycolatopsis thailandensis TaxID=589330 RepID=A0A229SI07_9PSEU|nr:class I SAM-dependent methyltransferase [Amycolatopsis thailandensis]OXM58510.1 SAM-dependent methyltransferase [Amycolatopsis thailandensis]